MNKNLIAGLAVLVILAGAAMLALGSKSGDNTTEDTNHASTAETSSDNSATSTEAVQATAVEIKDFAFTPATIKIKVGDTVTWTNQDSAEHTVTADTESNDAPMSELLAKGESYKFTFTKAGTYTYHCTPHPNMKGTVIVE